jgi:hypothetical protein
MLSDIVRQVLLAEVRAFVTQPASMQRQVPIGSRSSTQQEVLGNDDLVQEIRNVLWMPQGAEEHARILLSASGIDPEQEGQREYVKGGGMAKDSSLSILTGELTGLDRHMSEFIVRSFGRLRGETGPGAVNLPKQVRASSGAYELLIRALESGFSSSVDTQVSRERGGKVQAGALSPIKEEDLVDVVIDDMIEIVLSHAGEADRIDFDRVEEEMQRLVDSLVDEGDTQAAITAKLSAAFSREISSARSKATRQERERGARVADSTVRKMISNVEGLLKLFVSRVVSKDTVPVEEYGRAFSALLSKACEIEDDYELPQELANMRIDPVLPREIDDGIVDFIRAVHTELMAQVSRSHYLRMVYHVLTDQTDLYDDEGNPNPTYDLESPHPAYGV